MLLVWLGFKYLKQDFLCHTLSCFTSIRTVHKQAQLSKDSGYTELMSGSGIMSYNPSDGSLQNMSSLVSQLHSNVAHGETLAILMY
jgi:hypothetical protein